MEVELDITQDNDELLERIAIIASEEDIKLAYYVKTRRFVVREK